MSIDMYVSSAQEQATSVNTMCQKQIQGYQQLQQAINQFVMSSAELQGKTYDSAKQYFSAVLLPLAKGGMLLSEATAKACQKFPDDYQSQVDSGDLKSSELEEQIKQYQQGIDTANAILQSLSTDPALGPLMKAVRKGVNNVKDGQEKAKKKLEEKLEKLKAFDASSPSIFSEIATLESAVNAGAGTFTMPKKEDMAWATHVNAQWEKREEANQKKIEVKKVTIPGKVNGDGYYYQVFVDGVYDKEATRKYNLAMVKRRTIGGLNHMGEFSGINDLYRVATGKDWYTGTKDSRLKAAGFIFLDLIGVKKAAKVLKATKLAEVVKTGKKVTKVKVSTKSGKTIKKGTVVSKKNVSKYKKTSVSKIKVEISEQSLKHADVGDFTINPSTGKVSKMKGGGHGQSNIDYLKENGFEVNIEKTYPNGVRTGNVPHHKTPSKRTGTGQSWFPENWTSKDIESAGQHIASQSNFASAKNGEVIFGDYNGVRVGVIKTDGKIGTIFPDGTKQP